MRVPYGCNAPPAGTLPQPPSLQPGLQARAPLPLPLLLLLAELQLAASHDSSSSPNI